MTKPTITQTQFEDLFLESLKQDEVVDYDYDFEADVNWNLEWNPNLPTVDDDFWMGDYCRPAISAKWKEFLAKNKSQYEIAFNE